MVNNVTPDSTLTSDFKINQKILKYKLSIQDTLQRSISNKDILKMLLRFVDENFEAFQEFIKNPPERKEEGVEANSE